MYFGSYFRSLFNGLLFTDQVDQVGGGVVLSSVENGRLDYGTTEETNIRDRSEIRKYFSVFKHCI